jgi:hypothetical protein
VLGALGGNAQVYGTTESTESTEDATLYVLGALGGNAQVYGTTKSTESTEDAPSVCSVCSVVTLGIWHH